MSLLRICVTVRKIGPQCVRVATVFLFALVCEYDVVEYVQLF